MDQTPTAPAGLTSGYDSRGTVQSALLACEVGLKAGAAAQGPAETEIKDRFGDLADAVNQKIQGFDRDRVCRGQPAPVRAEPLRLNPAGPA